MNTTTVDIRKAIRLVGQEREEQVNKHGYGPEHDLGINKQYELRDAAIALVHPTRPRYPQSWDREVTEHMHRKSYKERLIIAAALLCAEFDRVEAAEAAKEAAATKTTGA